ncbi:hypothetical protein ACH5AO_35285 [Streptomyces sp. NPDC018964]|uniref:hypothetical protein n=1 Tax=unclassified Streptomyces TaxID=2593676 RepID=UPI0037A043D6
MRLDATVHPGAAPPKDPRKKPGLTLPRYDRDFEPIARAAGRPVRTIAPGPEKRCPVRGERARTSSQPVPVEDARHPAPTSRLPAGR